MSMLSATELANTIGVSKVRISQLTSAGRLNGCWQGEGRARRYDLAKVAEQLGRTLHPGQMLGNGAETRKSLVALKLGQAEADDGDDDTAPSPKRQTAPRESGALGEKDPDRYELARTQKAEEEARRLRRQNSEAEGTFVLASEVERQVARMMAQEIAEVEAVLRDGSRRVADKLGVDFKTVRQILMDQWRSHRAKRTLVLDGQAEAAGISAVERAEDI
ncbi:MAG: hypothetical protein ACOH2H_16145 [Cypionkella sp.]